MIRVFGDEIPLRASVEVLNGYSAHGDRTELLRWIEGVRSQSKDMRQVHLVHGEPEAQDVFANELLVRGMQVTRPTRGSTASF
jgi:metallo-beta-lactamase family protein